MRRNVVVRVVASGLMVHPSSSFAATQMLFHAGFDLLGALHRETQACTFSASCLLKRLQPDMDYQDPLQVGSRPQHTIYDFVVQLLLRCRKYPGFHSYGQRSQQM